MEEFDPVEFHQLLMDAYEPETGVVNAQNFVKGVEVVPRLLDCLGGALRAGNSSLIDKISIVKQRMSEAAKDIDVSEEEISLQDIIHRDIEKKWTHTGKRKRHATRNIIRLVWFLDFVVALFNKLVDDSLATTREVLIECWNGTLGPRQKTMVNMTTTAALRVATPPTHEKLFELFKVENLSPDERKELFLKWATDVNSIAETLWNFFRENNIEKVP